MPRQLKPVPARLVEQAGRMEVADRGRERSGVYFIADVCERLQISLSVFKRLRRHGAFPIDELRPRLDRRPRWSREAVERWLAENGRVDFRKRRIA